MPGVALKLALNRLQMSAKRRIGSRRDLMGQRTLRPLRPTY